MKKIASAILSVAMTATLLFSFACGKTGGGNKDGIKRVADARGLTDFEYTLANMTATDKEGRVAEAGAVDNGNDVGIFYHTWHGWHETAGDVLDITKLLEQYPDYLGSDYLNVNSKKFHYWGEPLYGYYCSDDPWVITRHIEIMMAMGVDYLVYDCTNAQSYTRTVIKIFEILQIFYDQGFDVPKVTFYTNTGSANVILSLYNDIYSKELYKDLWYAPNGKPLIIGVRDNQSSNPTLYENLYTNYFDFRESQWPNGSTIVDKETGMPWMSWNYPQENYNGYMSVSLAQHPAAKMSDGEYSNKGRGYDWNKFVNRTKNKELGTNYEGQWQSVFDNNADAKNQPVNNVMITGFNEWMAQKLDDGDKAFFVDTFSEEYSRDVEMMKGGYEDNYVIQTLTNTRKFKYTSAKHYTYDLNTVDISDFTLNWGDFAKTYRDFAGDALNRSYSDAFKTTTYTDNSARNDITSVQVTHDKNNLYVKVTCVNDITAYNGTDVNWMNLLIKTTDGNENAFGSFNYIINRTPTDNGTTSIEKSTGGYNWTGAGAAQYKSNGNAIIYSIPLSALGLTSDNCYVRIKACDNVTKYDDITDYYVSGDSAPIGRFAYSYGY